MENKNYKIPLVIGITGHRDIDQKHIGELKNRVYGIFDYLIEKYPHSPIVFLSPLADGADRIAAEVAINEKYKNSISISVPLPMDELNYKDTFAKGITTHKDADEKVKIELEKQSKKDFDEIMDKVNNQENEYIPKIIPMLFDKELYEKSTDDEKRLTRRKQYSKVGEYIAIHSNILIAMYDECEEEKEGGTKEIVRKKLTGDFEHFQILDEDVTYPEDGIVYAISAPKGSNECTTNYQLKKLFPNGEEHLGLKHSLKDKKNILNKIKEFFSKPCISSNVKDSYNMYTQHHKHIECFNVEVDKNIDDIKKNAKKDIEKLSGCANLLIHKNIMIRRSAAQLSRLYQNEMKNIEKYILALIGITIFLVMIKSNFMNFEYLSYIDIGYVVLIGLFFGGYQKFKGYKEKTEDYRAISESLRVQTAWNMANINDATALYYLSHQKDEIGWIRTAVRGVNIFYLPKDDKETFCEKQVNSYWVDEQIGYFEKNIEKYNSDENNIDKEVKRYFGIFIIFTIVFLILDFTTEIGQCTTAYWNLTIVDFIKIALIGIPATIASYLKSKQLFDGNNDLVKEYKLSLDIFKRAKKLLDDPKKDKQKVYKNLGIEALRENSSWLITRRTKEYNAAT